jgi:hypothetical protein
MTYDKDLRINRRILFSLLVMNVGGIAVGLVVRNVPLALIDAILAATYAMGLRMICSMQQTRDLSRKTLDDMRIVAAALNGLHGADK